MHRPTINRKTVLIVCISIVSVIFICLCVAFGFVKVILPSFLEMKFKSQITNTYDTAFSPLDPYLEKMGVTLQRPGAATCNNGPYSPSDPCNKYRTSKDIKVIPAIAANWARAGQELDDYLESQHWQRATGSERFSTFADILANTGDHQTMVSYYFESDGVECSISADYILGENGVDSIVSVSESCSKRTLSPSEWLQ